jgi:hypothetical protein
MMKPMLTTASTRRQALQALGMVIALPLPPLQPARAAQVLPQQTSNQLWRPMDISRS